MQRDAAAEGFDPVPGPTRPEPRLKSAPLRPLSRRADGVIIASPSYHGGLSGLVKNALDYTEDMRTDRHPYLAGRALGCITNGAGWRAPAATLVQLRTIGHALRAWPTPLGVAMNSSEPCFDPGGEPIEPYREQLTTMVSDVVGFARSRAALIDTVG